MSALFSWLAETVKIGWMVASWFFEMNKEKKLRKERLLKDLANADTQKEIELIINSFTAI